MNIVFLDIDGVLQPRESEDHFYEYSLQTRKLINDLSLKYGADYTKYNYMDVLATYYDWKEEAVERVRWILDKANAKIIVSSDWRKQKTPNKMPDLLKMHKLDSYWYKDNIVIDNTGNKRSFEENRSYEIQDSLKRYPIDNFVILDDKEGMATYFPDNTVITHDYISLSDTEKAVKILRKTF